MLSSSGLLARGACWSSLRPRGRREVSILALLLSTLFAVLGVACTKPEPDPATLRAGDKSELERLIALDVKASQAMRAADDVSVNDAGAASDVLAKRARPSIDLALSSAEAASMKTDWGRAKKDALVAVLRDRKTELPKYEEAIKGNDPDKMLAAITAQADIERRALAVVAAVQEGR